MSRKLYKLKGKLQHYQWGGFNFLPSLLSIPNTDHKPCAEYWLGAHDNAPSELPDNQNIPLNEFIRSKPEVLGEKVKQQFGRLPYLLKVLDVKDMLSIQVHPSKQAAVIEFENENKKGVPLNAPYRNYKDNNHKPELMVALGDFWLLHGFKPEEEIIRISQAIPEFRFMFPLLEEGGLPHLYKVLMELDQDKVNRILSPLLDRITPAYREEKLNKDNPDFWAARASLTYNEIELCDRGIFSVYLLNLVHLKPGEAIFQDAGVLHAYLEGQNIEIMANSDNVLRGGLTPKYIDVQELMKHVDFKPITPKVIHGEKKQGSEEVFRSPAVDFELSRLLVSPSAPASLQCGTTDIFLLMEGAVTIKEDAGDQVNLRKGEAAAGMAGAALSLQASENAVLYRASVPV
jgi:mannose-6-phosphate isomerase